MSPILSLKTSITFAIPILIIVVAPFVTPFLLQLGFLPLFSFPKLSPCCCDYFNC